MKTIYLLTISVLALVLAMCAGCDEREESREFRIEVRSVTVEPRPDDPTKYQACVCVRIHNADVVQEIYVQGVHRWTEHLALLGDNTWILDKHLLYQGESREIVTTPGSVEGVVANEWGTSLLWTEPGLKLGPEMAGLPVQGTVTKRDDSRAIRWSIEALPDGVRLTIDGKVTWYAK